MKEFKVCMTKFKTCWSCGAVDPRINEHKTGYKCYNCEAQLIKEDSGRLNDIKFIQPNLSSPPKHKRKEPVYLVIAKNNLGQEYHVACLTPDYLIEKIRQITGETSNHQLLAVIVSY
jgi:predicted RNA-binding Zn-ribbon protein involved in translation (DUF1610 family)